LREALGRIFADRLSGFWLFAEPIAHIAFITLIFSIIRLRTIAGIEMVLWLTLGMILFFIFKRTATQAMNAINASRALFAYRQVKPVDTVLVRAAFEGFIMILVLMLMLSVLALFGFSVVPDNPLTLGLSLFGLWLVGLGFGLVVSVANTLLPEIGQVLELVMLPMYLISGVIFPLQAIPLPYREWVMYNPVAHGIEGARAGLSSFYHAVPELDMLYLYAWGVGLLWLGLVLHKRFQLRLLAK
jgi:capsular polysaccharide transport system permease protein